MTVRQAGIDDFDEVYRLLYQILKLHADWRPDVFKEGTVISHERFEYFINDPNHIYLLWIENNKPCGLCHMIKNEIKGIPICRESTTAYIEDFVVDKSMRGKGIGQKLFRAAKKQAAAWNADSLELNVWAVNKDAFKFYKKIGLNIKSLRMECKLNKYKR